ncbi:MAG TPA: hypothetical protein VMV23_00355 [Candidatus Nanopelagicaceae bacterium]|nr:hypothetical protein [Candidatus Nanopelagicaceae bacterium]
MSPAPLSLYPGDRLAGLLPGTTVYLCESHAEADAGWAEGMPIFCNPFGEDGGEWRPSYTEQLRGFNVVIIPSMGRPWSYGPTRWFAIARAVRGIALSVKVCPPPPRYPGEDLREKWMKGTYR